MHWNLPVRAVPSALLCAVRSRLALAPLTAAAAPGSFPLPPLPATLFRKGRLFPFEPWFASGLSELSARQARRHFGGVVDGAANETRFLQIPVVRDVAMLGAVDGLLLTDMTAPQATYDALLAAGSRAVAVPRLLKVTSPEMERA